MKNSKTLIILAGGKSCRMGKNKAFLKYKGDPFIEVMLRKFVHYDERIIVANDVTLYQYPGVTTIQDIYPDRGPLCGLYTGLLKARNDCCVVITVDTPFLSSEVMDFLSSMSEGVDAVIPVTDGYPHTISAVYNRTALETIGKAVESGERKVRRVLDRLEVKHVGEDVMIQFGDPERLFRNINTPVDYQKAISV